MARASAMKVFAVALLAAGGLAALPSEAWLPPPPEFDDVAPGSGLDMPVWKWDPSLGAADSLLDLLPPGGPAAGDFNDDGYPDLFVPSTRYTDAGLNALRAPHSKLYFNDGSLPQFNSERFLDVTDVSGIDVQGYAYAASWADYDNDGHLDLFVGGYHLARLYRNTGLSTFTDVTSAAGLPQDGFVVGGAWGDYDRDGRADLFLAQLTTWTEPDGLVPIASLAGKANTLLRSNADGTFTDVSASAGIASVSRRSTGAAFVDVDEDGFQDVYVTNYGEPAELWHNNGDGTFSEAAAAAGLEDGREAACQSWEDVDSDGLLDLFVTHEAGAADGLFLNNADGTFADRSDLLPTTAPGDGWGCAVFDMDGDNDMDIVVGNADPSGATAQAPHVLVSRLDDDGALSFGDQLAEASDHDSCNYMTNMVPAGMRALGGLTAADFNMDGFNGASDVAALGPGGDQLRLFKNTNAVGACENTWPGGAGDMFRAVLRGQASNRGGLGAKLTATAGTLSVTRATGASMSWGSQSLTEVQFGLKKDIEGGYQSHALPVSVTLQWPSGTVDTYTRRWGHSAAKIAEFIEGVGWKNDTFAPRPFLTPTGATVLGQNNWYTSPTVTLTLLAQEPKLAAGTTFSVVTTLRYSLDGATWVTLPRTGGALPAFSGEGTHKLWVEVADNATIDTGSGKVLEPNRAVYLYPIRIDSAGPEATALTPARGGIYVQGREVARVDAGLDRALVLTPTVTDFSGLGDAGLALEASLGSRGVQDVQLEASDATSGVWKVAYELRRSSGALAASSVQRLAPYVWAWEPGQVAVGEYTLTATAYDGSGQTATTWTKLEVVPTGPEGVEATAAQGPSLPSVG